MNIKRDKTAQLIEKLNIKLPSDEKDLEGKALMKVGLLDVHIYIYSSGLHAQVAPCWRYYASNDLYPLAFSCDCPEIQNGNALRRSP